MLEPGWTDYNRRVLYSVYDVTENIQKGANLISVMLGEGWLGHEHTFFMKIFGTNPSWLKMVRRQRPRNHEQHL